MKTLYTQNHEKDLFTVQNLLNSHTKKNIKLKTTKCNIYTMQLSIATDIDTSKQ